MLTDAGRPGRPARQALGLTALALIPLTIYLALAVPDLTLPGALLLLLCEVVVVAATTNMLVAALTAAAAFLLTNWFLIPPYHTLFVASTDDVIVLMVFLGSAILAAWAVRASLRFQQAAGLAQMEAVQLRQAVSTAPGRDGPQEILRRLAEVHRFTDVSLVDASGMAVSHVHVSPPPPEAVMQEVALANGYRLIGSSLPAIGQDPQLLISVGNAAVRSHEAQQLEALDRDRSALSASVGHDLRTPIAAITLAASALQPDLPAEVRAELTGTIVESAHNLDRLVANLLDMSRLEAGGVVAHLAGTDTQEVAAAALLSLNSPDVVDEIPDDLPEARADAGLLERILANLIANAIRHGGPPILLRGRDGGDSVVLEVIDHGPGVPAQAMAGLFDPFVTSGDRSPGGTGLGLAIAQRFCAAMGAQLTPSATPGGGLTMTVHLDRWA